MIKTRLYVAALLAICLATLPVIGDLNESDAVTEYPVTIFYHPNATIVFDGVTVTSPNSSEPYGYGDPITITATLATGYTFDHWYGNNVTEGEDWTADSTSPDIDIVGNVVTYHTWCYGEEEYTLYLSGAVSNKTITFVASPNTYGSFDMDAAPSAVGNVLTLPYGTHFTVVDTGTVLIASTPDVPFTQWVYADPNPTSGGYSYSFDSWSRSDGTYTLTSDITITAYFTRSAYTPTYTVTVDYNSSYGSVSRTTFLNVPQGTSVTASGDTLTVGSTGTSVATPRSSTTLQNFYLSGWTIPSATVTGNMTVTANFYAAYKDFPVTIFYHPNATIVFDGVTVTSPNSSETYGYGDPVTITATLAAGYTFDHWHGFNVTENEGWDAYSSSSGVSISGNVVTYNTWCYGEEEYTLYLTGGPGTNYTVTFTASPSAYGSMTNASVQAQYGASWYIFGDKFFIDGQVASRAVPKASDLSYDYDFDSWSYLQTSGTVTTNMDVTAYFTRSPVVHSDGVHWTNDQYNGRVDTLYVFDSSDNKTHTMTADLYDGAVSGETTLWTKDGYSLEVSMSYVSSLSVTATLKYNGSAALTQTLNLGKWTSFVITLDTDKGLVYVTPVKQFYSFTDYTLYDNQKRIVLDFSSRVSGDAILDIVHEESDTGTNSPRFSVVGTSVFLNTFGIVLYNPTINLHDYFPQYEAIRVNFYSFALYGESITINGVTYVLDGSRITVQYVSDGDEHYLPGVMPNATVQTRTFELSNIYVTYQDGHCYLTFVNDRFTLDLGAYTPGNETISMQGLWYFATMVYEPYAAVEKHLSDWKILPETDKSQMVLLFLAILILAGAAVAIHARKSGLGIVDLVIIGAALVFGLVLLG